MGAMTLVLAVRAATPQCWQPMTGQDMETICAAFGAAGAEVCYADDALALLTLPTAGEAATLLAAQQRAVMAESDGCRQLVGLLQEADEPLLWADWCRFLDRQRRRPAVDGVLPTWSARMPAVKTVPDVSQQAVTLTFVPAQWSRFAEMPVAAVCDTAAVLLQEFVGQSAASMSVLGVSVSGDVTSLLPPLLRLAAEDPTLAAALTDGPAMAASGAGLWLDGQQLHWTDAATFFCWIDFFQALAAEEYELCRRLGQVLNDESQAFMLSRVALAMNQSSLPAALAAVIYEATIDDASRALMTLGLTWAMQ